MSYLHPDYDNWYNYLGGPVVLKVAEFWQAPKYSATEYEDGWFSVESVEGDEWFGEFPSRAEAEAHLGLVFSKHPGYDYSHD